MTVNPFENARASFAKKAKFEVHNRTNANANKQQRGPSSALQRSLEARQQGLKRVLKQQHKSGSFVDRRIGETNTMLSQDQRMLARVVRERVRRTKKSSKFTLDDNDNDNDHHPMKSNPSGITLTHKGKVIGEDYDAKQDSYDDVILSDDEDDRYGGQLDKMDTEMHFGGGAFDAVSVNNPYGSGAQNMSMGDAYRSRKTDLDEMIKRRKMEKAEKAKRKEEQMDTFENMDEHFHELKSLLQFRDKEKERQNKYQAKQTGTLSDDEKEMDDWNKEVKEYHMERKVKATDRTKTPEEIAKEEADRLHELETRRIARMNGDFEDDDLSDISDDDEGTSKYANKKKKKTTKKKKKNPDELDSDDDDSDNDNDKDKLEPRFTPDGLVYVDKDGNIVKTHGDNNDDDDDDSSDNSTAEESDSSDKDSDDDEESSEDDGSELASLGGTDDEASAASDSDNDSDNDGPTTTLTVGTKVMANYHAEEQFDGMEAWHPGTIAQVNTDNFGNTVYYIDYDDGDIEENVKRKHLRVEGEKAKVKKENTNEKKKAMKLKLKRKKAKDKARKDIPYVFEVPTTLEALHDIIGNYAQTGEDACLIIERIHASNSVRLDKRNQEKMQNFYDVLLRRFVGVGDALHKSGNGGSDLGRYDQLNSLTMTLYQMAQDSPNCAGAVWGRRLGIFQKAHAKRLRDSELVTSTEDDDDEESFTAWHSTGTLLLLRAMGHIFPVTDLRHSVVTPSIILLGQSIAQTPVGSLDDICRGLSCCSLMMEYCKDATRLPSEALSFLAGTMRLFSHDLERSAKGNPLPSLQVAIKWKEIRNLRKNVVKYAKTQDDKDELELPKMSLERGSQKPSTMSAAIFGTVLCLMEAFVVSYSKTSIESEVFEPMVLSILSLNDTTTTTQKDSLPQALTKLVAKTGNLISSQTQFGKSRPPLTRRKSARSAEVSIQSFAPRMEDPNKYVMSRDKGKTQVQAERDRIRREYRREHKAAARELRLDAAYIENERRKEKKSIDDKARAKRNKNYSWLEQEQATINQQVRKGGGLLKGGGTGLARNTAASGKLGIKRGGKF